MFALALLCALCATLGYLRIRDWLELREVYRELERFYTRSSEPPRIGMPRPVRTEAPEARALSELRAQAARLADELLAHAVRIKDRQAAADVFRIAATARLLAENAGTDEADVLPTLRFLERYADSVRKLVQTYGGLEQAGGATPRMGMSMRQIKTMLADFAGAIERFRLSLYENNVLAAAVEMDVVRSLLAKDGLASASAALRFAAAEDVETTGGKEINQREKGAASK